MFFNQNIGENICVNVYDVEGWSELWYDYAGSGVDYYSVSGKRKDKFTNSAKYRYCLGTGWGSGQYYNTTYFTLNNIILGEYLQIQYNNKKIVYAGLNAGYLDGFSIDKHFNGFFCQIRRGTWIFNQYAGDWNYDPTGWNGASTSRGSLRGYKWIMPYYRLTNRLWSWTSFGQYGYWYHQDFPGGDDYLYVPGLASCKFYDIRY